MMTTLNYTLWEGLKIEEPMIAPLRGSTILYMYLLDDMVLLMKDNYNYFVTRVKAFEDLYEQLDDRTAALREDCIEYTIYHPDRPLCEYPEWYINAYDNGMIFQDDKGDFLFYELDGDMIMTPGAIMLVNFLGQLKYMEADEFERYYEVIDND